MIDYFSKIKQISHELGVDFKFIESYNLKTDESTMDIHFGDYLHVRSNKKDCKTNTDIDINRDHVTTLFFKNLLKTQIDA